MNILRGILGAKDFKLDVKSKIIKYMMGENIEFYFSTSDKKVIEFYSKLSEWGDDDEIEFADFLHADFGEPGIAFSTKYYYENAEKGWATTYTDRYGEVMDYSI